MALSKLRLCDLFWVAWTEFGSVGVGRRAALGQNDKSSEGSGHPGLDPVPRALRSRADRTGPQRGLTCHCTGTGLAHQNSLESMNDAFFLAKASYTFHFP